ncbi:hypothetical protein Poli38472_011871 [Pythium oligandrum]|uniref:Phosphate acetyltransferase n=1 Tax=Pythium oligandrum TaxID=41045 RepID=A0A8K1C8S2_PYTOL|nr:hypothetical protein Poli38472_011871 [Pythium oligandrum]|eukprot:TMW58283.1 hypothetical protein Poli38472_011871 [Pythium oligandrum]
MWRLRRPLARVAPTSSAVFRTPLRRLSSALGDGKVPADSLYVTSTDMIRKTSPVLIGLSHILEQKFTSVGYFRPIAPAEGSLNRDHHVELMKSELELSQPVDELYGVSSDHALQSWLEGKEDDLVEEILTKYEQVKQKHDFMIIEGAQIMQHETSMSWKINVDLAKALGSPVLHITDMGRVVLPEDDMVREIVSRSMLGKEQVDDAGLNYFGTIANRVNTKDPKAFGIRLRAKLGAEKMPFLGFLPFDDLVASKRLNEVTHKLGAKQLFGNKQIANNVVVSDAIVATSHLKDLFEHMKKRKDGLLVIASADRSDVMLGLLASRIPGVLPSVAGIVLTNGDYPQSNTQEILRGVADFDKTGLSIPIFSVEEDSYRAANKLSRIASDILPTSVHKIQQCRNLFDQFVEKEALIGELNQGYVVNRSPKQFKHFVFNKARNVQRHIVLTEGEDIRVLQAADEVLRQRLSKVTILGNPEEIRLHAKTLNLDLSRATIIDPAKSDLLDKYSKYFYEKRKHKGVTPEYARDTIAEATYFGTMMVEMGDADGMVSGACHTTANTIRPALQLIKTLPERPLVSSIFFMCLESGVRIYGDCAVNTDPTAEQLAQIAVTSAESAEAFGMIPRVALLSYATGDSNTGPIIDKVRQATKMAQEMRPDLDIYGPIQYDAAVDESIAKTKLKAIPSGAKVGGHANVLIFPDLNTGNNTYKAVQQSTGCIAMGPMLQGLRKPVNDLSRGATVKDIVTTVAITAIQAEQMIAKQKPTDDDL